MSWRFTAISVGYAVLISSVGLGLYAFYFHEYNACFVGLLGKFKMQLKTFFTDKILHIELPHSANSN